MEQEQPRRSDRHDDPGGRSRRGALLALLVVFLLIVGGVVAAGAYYGHCKGASGPTDDVAFTVEPGTSGEEVVAQLHDLGVLRCDGFVGRILLRGTGKADQIRAGSYTLTTNMTFDEALLVLSTPPPPVPTARLTIPEGYRLTQIAERVKEALGIPEDRFLTAAQDTDWSLDPYLPTGKGTEGFLFPETYRFEEDATSREVIQRLLDQFDTEAEGLDWSNAEDLGVLRLRGRGDRVDDRAGGPRPVRPREDLGSDLQPAGGGDAARDRRDGRLHRPGSLNGLTVSDFEIDSPYNTRLHTGLPPTPIASPGIPSLRAALNPAHVPYLYYVLCSSNGAHRFSVSYDQFLSDKAECLG